MLSFQEFSDLALKGNLVPVTEKLWLYRGFDGKARLISPRFLTALEPRLGNGI